MVHLKANLNAPSCALTPLKSLGKKPAVWSFHIVTCIADGIMKSLSGRSDVFTEFGVFDRVRRRQHGAWPCGGPVHVREADCPTLLKWKAFFVKDSAALLCVQSSERDTFRYCSTAFKIRGCPTLLLGASSEMPDYIKFDPQIILRLADNSGTLQRSLTTVKGIVENGGTLDDVSHHLRDDRLH